MERVALASGNHRSHWIHEGLAVFIVWVVFLLAGVVRANLVSIIRCSWIRTHAVLAASVVPCFGSMVFH